MTTKDKLQQLLQCVDGENETVCIIYCDNEEKMSSVGFIGDIWHTSGAIAHYLLKVCKMECEENELAKMIGISTNTLLSLEKGKSWPTMATINKITDYENN